jgi:hypothetical protein
MSQWKYNKHYIFWVCVCSLRYPACNADARYRHLWPVSFYHIFVLLSRTRHDFRKQFNGHKMCVLYKLCLTFLTVGIKECDIINAQTYSVQCPLHLSDFNQTLAFSVDSQKEEILKYQISSKSVPRETCCHMPVDTPTGTMILTVVLRNILNALKTNASIYAYTRLG